MWSVGFGGTPTNVKAKYNCSNFNGFVSPQEVVKSLVISVLMFSFHFSDEKCSVLSYGSNNLAYSCQLSLFSPGSTRQIL